MNANRVRRALHVLATAIAGPYRGDPTAAYLLMGSLGRPVTPTELQLLREPERPRR